MTRLQCDARRLWRILSEYDFAPVELVVILYSFLWGVGLCTPLQTFSISSYHIMAEYASEEVWGLVIIALSMMHGYGLIRMKTLPRKAGLGGQLVVWTMIAYLTFAANPNGLGYWHFGLVSVVAFWCWARISRYD